MKNFSAIDRIVCYNRGYTVNADVVVGSYLSTLDARSSSTAIAAHQYNGTYYGIAYVNLAAVTDEDFFIHLAGNDLTTPGSTVICAAVRVVAGTASFRLILGTWNASGIVTEVNYINAVTTFPSTNKWVKLAWLQIGDPAHYNTSAAWINQAKVGFDAYIQFTPPPTNMPFTAIFGPRTPVGFKLGKLWTGFEPDMTIDKFQRILDRFSGDVAYFMGRRGDYPTSKAASTYINASEPNAYDLAFEGYYSPTGTVNYTQTHEIVRVS